MIRIYPTDCCALCQMSCSNLDSLSALSNAITNLKLKADSRIWADTQHDAGGHRSVFTITTPTEEILANNLKQLGFKEINTFSRRTGYDPGLLKMWVLNW